MVSLERELYHREEMRAERAHNLFRLGLSGVALLVMPLAYTGVIPIPKVVLPAVLATMVLLAVYAVSMLWLIQRGRFRPFMGYLASLLDYVLVGITGWVASERLTAMTGVYIPAFETPVWFLLIVLLVGPAFRYSPGLVPVQAGALIVLHAVWYGQGWLSGRMEHAIDLAADLAGPAVHPMMVLGRTLVLLVLSLSIYFVCRNSRRVVQEAVAQQVTALEEQHRRVHMQELFGRYFSPKVAEQLVQGQGIPHLGGDRLRVVVLISDIRNFTARSERLEPDQLVTEMNRYFAAMTALIFANGGTLLKISGDGMLAVYGLPSPSADDDAHAVLTARQMLERVEALNAEAALPGLGPIRIGIGIHAGEVVVGNIGSPQHMEYTVMGDTVNVASRVEALNKELGTALLVTEEVAARAGHHALADCGEHPVKGRQEPVHLWGFER